MQTLHEHSVDPATVAAANAFLERTRKTYSVKYGILFGSRVRGDFREDSDVDVAVLLNGLHGAFVTVKLDMADIAYDVLLEKGIRIQPYPVWEDEWADQIHYSNPALLQNIEREGVIL